MEKTKPKCTNCYDKGFATEMVGATSYIPDFERDGNKRIYLGGPGVEIRYCKCAKGRSMKRRHKLHDESNKIRYAREKK